MNKNILVGFSKQSFSDLGNMDRGKSGVYTVHDDLCAGVIWVDDGTAPFALITADLGNINREQADIIKALLADSLPITEERITISASHTHSGLNIPTDVLASRILLIAKKARNKAVPAQVGYIRLDTGNEYTVNRRKKINDRFGVLTNIFAKNSTIIDRAGKKYMDVRNQIVDFVRHGHNISVPQYIDKGKLKKGYEGTPSPAAQKLLDELPSELLLDGPVDSHLEALTFRGKDKSTIGTIVRFASHPVIFRGNWTKEFSADYPGVLTREVSKATGGAPAVFMNGPCGNTKPVSVVYGEKEMEKFGMGLAGGLLKALATVEYKPLEKVHFSRENDTFARRDLLVRMNDEINRETTARIEKALDGPFDPYEVKRLMDTTFSCWKGQNITSRDPVSLPFSLAGFNDIALVTMPGEIFAEFSLELKKKFAGKKIMIVSLTDSGEAGYVPTEDSFKDGGYESATAALAPGAGEKMVDILSNMLGKYY